MLLHTMFILDGMKGDNPEQMGPVRWQRVQLEHRTRSILPMGAAIDKMISSLAWCNTQVSIFTPLNFSIHSNILHSTMFVGIKYNWYSSSGPWKSKGKLSDSRPYKSCGYRPPFQPGLHILEWRDGTEYQTILDWWGKHDYNHNQYWCLRWTSRSMENISVVLDWYNVW